MTVTLLPHLLPNGKSRNRLARKRLTHATTVAHIVDKPPCLPEANGTVRATHLYRSIAEPPKRPGVVRDHDERPSPVQASCQHKPSNRAARSSQTTPLPRPVCNRAASALVKSPPKGIGSQTKSRRKAYRNGRCGRRAEYPYSSQTKSRRKAYRNMLSGVPTSCLRTQVPNEVTP